MDLYLMIYLADVVTVFFSGLLKILFITAGVSLVGGLGVLFFTSIDSDERERAEWYPRGKHLLFKWALPAAALMSVLTLVPSKETAYKMMAVYAAQEIAQIEEVQQVGSKSLKVLNKLMDDYLGEEDQLNEQDN